MFGGRLSGDAMVKTSYPLGYSRCTSILTKPLHLEAVVYEPEVTGQSGVIERAVAQRTHVQTVEPGSPEEEHALSRLDDVREDETRSMRPDERDRARKRHARHWKRHFGG